MLTSYVKKQLIVFAILALTAALIIVFVYAKVPTAIGFGQTKLTALFSDGAGIYVNSNVSDRGVDVGRVTDVELTPQGVAVTMQIDSNNKIGADARAEIHSVSAVGEQYVDLISNQTGGPYLQEGAVIPVARTSVPEQIAPVLDKATTFLGSIPNAGLQTFLDEGYKAFNNLAPDLQTLLNSSQSLINTADTNYAQTAQLIQTVGPLLDTQNIAADSVLAYWHNLAAFTGVLRGGDSNFRHAFRTVHGAANIVNKTFNSLRSNGESLGHHTKTLGRLLGVYRPGLEQVLVTFPNSAAWEQIFMNGTDKPGTAGRGAHAAIQFTSVYEGCTTGFYPNHLRAPEDISDKDVEPDTYCKVPHNDPRNVRGARNIPCMEGREGMRAANVTECLGLEPTSNDVTPGSKAPALGLPSPYTGNVPEGPPSSFTPKDNQDYQSHYDRKNSTVDDHDPMSSFGGFGSNDSGKDHSWQSLMTGPLGR
jgi:phospholipid/cholesterol/gamma-HCH transport system substrate-binding protein